MSGLWVKAAVLRARRPPDTAEEFSVWIAPPDPNAPPPGRVPGSRTIIRMREKAEAAARTAAAAMALAAQVQRAFRPRAGKLFGVDVEGLMLRGPHGGIGTSERMARTLTPLAQGGRQPVEALVAAGGLADETALREALSALAPKLNAIGLRLCRRKTGLRMAKAR